MTKFIKVTPSYIKDDDNDINNKVFVNINYIQSVSNYSEKDISYRIIWLNSFVTDKFESTCMRVKETMEYFNNIL